MCSVTKVKNGSVFPAICHTRHLSRHALITFCNASRAGGVQWLKRIDFSRGHVTKNQQETII